MTINDKRPKPICECGDPDCLKGSQTFTPGKEQAQPEPVAHPRYTTLPADGEPVYQIKGNSGSQRGNEECWVEVSKQGFEDAVSEGKEVRLLYIASKEDEEVRQSTQYVIAAARKINDEAFAKGTQKVRQGLFVSLDFALAGYDGARASRKGFIQ